MRRAWIWLPFVVALLATPAPVAAQFRLEVYRNNASSTLAAGIDTDDTTFDVAAGHGARFPSPAGGQYMWITLEQSGTVEVLKCDTRSTDTISGCTRAQQGTSAASFTTGANVYIGALRGTLEAIQALTALPFVLTSTTSELSAEVTLLPVANGGTGIASGTSGGVLAYTASGTLASSGALAANAIVIGGGAGVVPSTTTTGTGVLTAIGNNTNATGGIATPDGTKTFTNTTIDAEGTGNTITLPMLVQYTIASCQGTTASIGVSYGTTAPTAECVTGSNTNFGVARYPDSDGDYDLQGSFQLPSDWTGNIDVLGKYRGSATSGDVVWQMATICVADAETADPAFNTASTTTDTQKGTTLQTNDFTISSVTVTGCAASEQLFWRLRRNRTHASDSTTGTLDLINLVFRVRRGM